MNKNYISTTSLYDSGEHLAHRQHKYTSKKQGANGKWVYYYGDEPTQKPGLGIKELGTYVKAKKQLKEHQSSYAKGSSAMDEAYSDVAANRSSHVTSYGGSIKKSADQKMYEHTKEQRKEARQRLADEQHEVDVLRHRYSQTTIGQITTTAKKTYDTGISFLKNLFK